MALHAENSMGHIKDTGISSRTYRVNIIEIIRYLCALNEFNSEMQGHIQLRFAFFKVKNVCSVSFGQWKITN